MKRVGIHILILFCILNVNAQEKKKLSDIINPKGYIKNLQTASFGTNLDNIVTDNLIHNRINLKVSPFKSVDVALEVRNRIFYGETVKSISNYGTLVDEYNGLTDLSFLLVDEGSFVFLTQIDRGWINWSSDKWDVRIGRQRINWGINLFWNSNDLFNAYSFVDFDYEERPGTDALRIVRNFLKQIFCSFKKNTIIASSI